MIEFAGIELGNVGITALVFGVTFLALFGFFDVSVIGVLGIYVFGYVFVAVFTQAGLSRLVKFLMALGTFTFNLDMSLDNVTRRQDIRDRIGLYGCKESQE